MIGSPKFLVLVLFRRRLRECILSFGAVEKRTLALLLALGFCLLFWRSLLLLWRLSHSRIANLGLLFGFRIVIVVLVHDPFLLLIWRVRLIRGTRILFPNFFRYRVFSTANFMVIQSLLRQLISAKSTLFLKITCLFVIPILFSQHYYLAICAVDLLIAILLIVMSPCFSVLYYGSANLFIDQKSSVIATALKVQSKRLCLNGKSTFFALLFGRQRRS